MGVSVQLRRRRVEPVGSRIFRPGVFRTVDLVPPDRAGPTQNSARAAAFTERTTTVPPSVVRRRDLCGSRAPPTLTYRSAGRRQRLTDGPGRHGRRAWTTSSDRSVQRCVRDQSSTAAGPHRAARDARTAQFCKRVVHENTACKRFR